MKGQGQLQPLIPKRYFQEQGCDRGKRTYHISILVFVLNFPKATYIGLLQSNQVCEEVGQQTSKTRMGLERHLLGCASFMASIGSAFVCRLRLCFSSADSVRCTLLPEPLERWVFSDLSDLPLELKPRLRIGDAGWGEAIFMTKPLI